MNSVEREISISQGWEIVVEFEIGIELGWVEMVCMIYPFELMGLQIYRCGTGALVRCEHDLILTQCEIFLP